MGRPLKSRTKHATETRPDLSSLYMTTRQIMEMYGISRDKAREHMCNIISVYNLDPARLPKKGVLPSQYVRMYFDQSDRGGKN